MYDIFMRDFLNDFTFFMRDFLLFLHIFMRDFLVKVTYGLLVYTLGAIPK